MLLLVRLCAALVLCSMLSTPAAAERPMRVLVMGDSFMTSNGSSQKSFSHVLSALLHTRVKSKAVAGARHLYALPISGALGMNISKQYRSDNWDYVVMNGGGNDLWMGCGCGKCTRKMEKLISSDGRKGAIPRSVARARKDGAKVIYVGYLRSPGRGSPIEACKPLGEKLEARIKKLAALDSGITFVSLADMVPHGDASFHALDMIHPSPKGSAEAARRVLSAIQANPS
ncbi:MAG: SGNH/GDSL hydrolase family protein [Sulfitobacter sp.]